MNDPSQRADADLQGMPVAADPENYRAREPLEVLVSRFADAVRRGAQPSIDDYARRYAEWADKIRELFPLIQTLEHWKTDKEMECLRRSVPDEFPVRQLGSYRLVRELGRGGMGIVFEAVHENTGQRVAVKLLPWRFATGMAQWEEQVQREARTIAGLRHANIVRVHSFGTHEGYCYYVMDLIAGVSLDWIIRRLRESADLVYVEEIRRAGRVELGAATKPDRADQRSSGLRRNSWNDFANIALQVALALAHAHEAGVLHNDVKPANLLLDGAGNVIVTDFGIGRRTAVDAEAAEEHQVGTLRYMAPERLLGGGDARSDVYSLGVTLYELVTQTPAFADDDRRQLMELILKSQFEPPRQLAPDVPRPLETIILNAMLADPHHRYPSAAAMASDLLRFTSGLPVAARRPGLLDRATRWISRRP
ncbi:MAG: serine/threonine protein kinase [Planctomycetia bacterium]|nr:serine/threonine protein kinase [Planctomycetia bacterium]